jgi:fructuronate reductase
MRLSRQALKDNEAWNEAGIELPKYNIYEMVGKTKENPTWVHFGAGNLFKGFIAVLQNMLLNKGKTDTGIIAVKTYDLDIVDKIYRSYDNLGLLVIMKADGSLRKKVIGSVAECLKGDVEEKDDWDRLQRIFSEPSLQMVSFTITEKGYALFDMSGKYYPDVEMDIENGPACPKHIISKAASLIYGRYLKGEFPIALVSMDNCSKNGEVLKNSIVAIVQEWIDRGFVDPGFMEYLNNTSKVSYPWTMIDKITPRPSEKVKEMLENIGLESTEINCTDNKTFIAPFVNAEESQYLVIEDDFPNGRMPLEEAGVYFTDRNTVNLAEKMKVSTCLNPLHTALAIFGCLLGYKSIADEMKDVHLRKLVEKIGYGEGLPAVANPGILNPRDFIDEVIKVRLPNPFIPDTPQRIATDTSQKMPIRFGETIKMYLKRSDLDVNSLVYIPLVIAGWCRYLLGLDDCGESMELSPDPMLDELKIIVSKIEFEKVNSLRNKLKPILSNENIFGLNLYDAGLGEKIEGFVKEMISGKNAVRKTLEKYLD